MGDWKRHYQEFQRVKKTVEVHFDEKFVEWLKVSARNTFTKVDWKLPFLIHNCVCKFFLRMTQT